MQTPAQPAMEQIGARTLADGLQTTFTVALGLALLATIMAWGHTCRMIASRNTR